MNDTLLKRSQMLHPPGSTGCTQLDTLGLRLPIKSSFHGMAPADPERRAVLSSFAPVPFARLPYRSIVVASNNDPYCPVRLANAYARAWGSEFLRLQNAGHINVESGHGEWPLGLALLQSLQEPAVALL